ncbi:MAG: WD40 repeat domain-containing protein [Bryobacteraceae bacterium]
MRTLCVLAVLAAAGISAAADRSLISDGVPNSVYFSADGKTVSSSCRDNHIRTWDVSSGKLLKDKTVPAGTFLIAPDVYAERDSKTSTVRVWDLSADRQMQLLNGAPTRRTAISADRKQLATASPDERSVRIWNMETGKQRQVLVDGIGGASELVFSPDGETLVSANYDNDVRVWKTKSGEMVKKVEDLTGAMFAGEFTPDGKQLILAGLDETVYIWDAKTFALNRTLKGHGETISALAISPDGRTLVTGGFDVITSANPVKVVFWDLPSGRMRRVVRAPHQVASLAFSPDGKWVAMSSGAKEISLWDLASGAGQ